MSGRAQGVRRELNLGKEIIEYTIRRSSRRTLGITVEPDRSVAVTAPEGADLSDVEAIVRRRRQWIGNRRREIATLPPPVTRREWVSGETHRYLGRQYRLRIKTGKPEVRLAGAYFRVSAPGPRDPVVIRKMMESWYRDHARDVFARRVASILEATPALKLRESPPIVVRKLQKRWGSCSPAGRLLMNVDAVKLPAGCIDYLLIHELCHLRVPNHGKAFWRLLDRSMPDWEKWRTRLARAEI